MMALYSHELSVIGADGVPTRCSCTHLARDLLGASAAKLDSQVLNEVAHAVYTFLCAEKRVTVENFASALGLVLGKLGYEVEIAPTRPAPSTVPMVRLDLRDVVRAGNISLDMEFSTAVVSEVRRLVTEQPGDETRIVSLCGLGPAVKTVLGKRRWCKAAGELADLVIHQARAVLARESMHKPQLILAIHRSAI